MCQKLFEIKNVKSKGVIEKRIIISSSAWRIRIDLSFHVIQVLNDDRLKRCRLL